MSPAPPRTNGATSNGFEIAETDLLLRPRRVFRHRQSGDLGFHIANPLRDKELLELARREAFALAADSAQHDAMQRLSASSPEWQRRYHLARIG